jgi:hypothetical protein
MLQARKNLHKIYYLLINENPPKPKINFGGVSVIYIDDFLNLYNTEVGAKVVFNWFRQIGKPINISGNQATKEEYFKVFCCDLQWAKDGGYCGDSSTQPPVPQPPVPQPVTGGKCESITYTENDILNGVAKIKNCMKGDVVGKIQSLLKTCGFPYFSKSGNIDNIYGPKTEKMVMAFQELPNSGLSDDGVVGKDTYKKLQSCKTSSTTTSPTTTTTTTAPIKISDPSIDDIISFFD